MNGLAFAAQSFHDHDCRRFACRECKRLLLTVAELQDGDRCEWCWERAAQTAAVFPELGALRSVEREVRDTVGPYTSVSINRGVWRDTYQVNVGIGVGDGSGRESFSLFVLEEGPREEAPLVAGRAAAKVVEWLRVGAALGGVS